MSIIQCPNGHFYNNAIFKSCPNCNGNAPMNPTENTAMPASQNSFDDEKTVAISYGKPADDSVTVAIYDTAKFSSEPVTGWLVCCKGLDVGKDFRLIQGINHVGRSGGTGKLQAALSDQKLTRDTPAFLIAYDSTKFRFIIAPGQGSATVVNLNGEILAGQRELSAFDVITLGDTTLRFVPFCGTDLNWN